MENILSMNAHIQQKTFDIKIRKRSYVYLYIYNSWNEYFMYVWNKIVGRDLGMIQN